MGGLASYKENSDYICHTICINTKQFDYEEDYTFLGCSSLLDNCQCRSS